MKLVQKGSGNGLKEKMIETFPTRDYNRAIEVPTYLFTPTMEKLQEKLQEKLKSLLQTKVGEVE